MSTKFFSNSSRILLRTARCALLPSLLLLSLDAVAADDAKPKDKAAVAAPVKAEATATPAPGFEAEETDDAKTDASVNATDSEEGVGAATEDDEAAATDEAEEPEPAAEQSKASKEQGEKDDEASWMNLKANSQELEDDEEAKHDKSHRLFRTLVLVEGAAKYGAFTVADPGQSLNDDDPEVETLRAGNLGGQVTLGIMPGGSAFTMGGRVRGGSYVGERITRGNVAAEMLFGANFARSARGDNFVHILGGIGVEFIPGENQDLLSLSLSGGAVVNSVAFGAGLNIGANDEYAVAMFGMHIGWGQLF